MECFLAVYAAMKKEQVQVVFGITFGTSLLPVRLVPCNAPLCMPSLPY